MSRWVTARRNYLNPVHSLAHAVVIRLVADVLDELVDALLGGAAVVGPGGRAEALVALQEGVVRTAVREARSPNSQILHQAQVLDLSETDSN